jgi:pimeloyl-ACP methyl ester carboxylesterase
MAAAHWLPFVLPLARSHRFILLDMSGFGGSSRVRLRGPDLLASHAQDVHDVLDVLHVDRPALGGISMGAATSLAYARLFGLDRFRAYLHVDQSPRIKNDATYRWGLFGDEQAEILGAWSALGDELAACGVHTPYNELPVGLRRAVLGKLAEFYSYAFHGRAFRASSVFARSERVARRFLEPESWPLYLDAMRSYDRCDYDFRPDLAKVKIPVHVHVGMESRMYPAEGQLAIRDLVPHARFVRFAGAGHAVPAEAPVRFMRALADFLRDSLD